jgi:transcriptional regulator with XRE-family HTH domain
LRFRIPIAFVARFALCKRRIGEAIKQARQSKNLTQEELGNLIGVQRAQISRIENGKNLTFSTIARVFKAMGISAKLEIGNMGKVALW